MKNPAEKGLERPFAVFPFIITIVATLVVFGFGMAFLTPSVWKASLAAPFYKWALVFLAAHLVSPFAEHLFHRFFLHSPFPFLGRLHRQHTLHHGLTNVKLIQITDGKGKVFNRYPILTDEQHEASYFPWFSLAAFIAVSIIVVVPLQVALPAWPIAGGVSLAIAWAISLYEIVHMIEHKPFETFWRPKVEHPRFGGFWRWFYCFHLRHHADNRLNENISGFFGIPLADFVLGTYAPWPRVYADGDKEVLQEEFEGRRPRPVLILRILDSVLLRV
jgi:hemolysin III